MAEGFIRFSHLGISPKGIKDRQSSRQINLAIQGTIRQIFLDSAKIFVEELSKDVLVETGESLGSLIPLARFVRASISLRPGNPRINKPELNQITGKPIKDTRRSGATGSRKGENAFGFGFIGNRFSFTFTIPVYQFFLHDSGLALNHQAGAVNATVRARAAQEVYVRREFHRRVGRLIGEWMTTGAVQTIGFEL